MSYTIIREDVWVGEIEDQPGGLADALESVSKTNVDLEFIIARRAHDKPGKTVLFLTPQEGHSAAQAVEQAGLSKWTTAASLRIDGPNQPGLATTIGRTVGNAGLNMRGVSGARVGEHAQIHLAFDNVNDALKAREALDKALNG